MKLDSAIIQALALDPARTKVASHGGSGFTTTAKITTGTEDGFEKCYFLKISEEEMAEVMWVVSPLLPSASLPSIPRWSDF